MTFLPSIIFITNIFNFLLINGQIPKFDKQRSNSFSEGDISKQCPSNFLTTKVIPVTYYQCASFIFFNFIDAQEYCNDIKGGKIYNLSKYPKGSFTLDVNTIKTSSNLRNFDYNLLLNVNSVSNNFWIKVWGDCFTFRCYSAKSFSVLKNKIVKEINLYRNLHGSASLTYHKMLEVNAERHVKTMSHKNSQNLDSDKHYGQLIGIMEKGLVSLVVKSWYGISNLYDYNRHTNRYLADMFTQMIWKDSKQIGCGIKSYGSRVFICCKIFPAGNIEGQYIKNIFPPQKSFKKARK